MLRNVIEKPRSSKDLDIWSYYEKTFLHTLRPMGGLPYVLAAWQGSKPGTRNKQLEKVLSKLVEKWSNLGPVKVSGPAKGAFTAYLKRRAVDPSPSSEVFEESLMKLLRQYQDPEWDAFLKGIADGHNHDLLEPEIVEAEPAASMVMEVKSEVELPEKKAEIIPEPSISPPSQAPSSAMEEPSSDSVLLMRIEMSKNSFLHDLSSLSLEYLRLREHSERLRRIVQKREATIKKLNTERLEKELILSSEREQTKKVESTTEDLRKEIERLQEECREVEKRADEKVHQIQMNAENEVQRYKYQLWMRMRPDLDDLMGEDLNEERLRSLIGEKAFSDA